MMMERDRERLFVPRGFDPVDRPAPRERGVARRRDFTYWEFGVLDFALLFRLCDFISPFKKNKISVCPCF